MATGGIEALAKYIPDELAGLREKVLGSDLGLAHWMDAPRLLTTNGLTDVKYFDASAMTGKVNIGAQITEAAYDKYLKDVDGLDTMAEGYAPNGPFKYLLGSNDDTLNMTVAGNAAADIDFKMDIKAGAGDDLVNFSFKFADTFTNQLANQMTLKNVSVDLGDGDDTFHFWGDGAMDVSDGAGNDALYVGQNAPNLPPAYLLGLTELPSMTANDYNAVWVFNVENATKPEQTAIFMGPDGAQSLDNNLLGGATSFTYTGAGTGADSEFLVATVTFKGIEGTARLALKPGNGTISAEDINHLIIEAINEDATLGKLLQAKDGAGSSLLVEALYNGKMNLADLGISFSTVKADGKGGTATFTNLDKYYATNSTDHANFASNTQGTDLFEGSNIGTDSATTIHMGLGNDVIALNAASGNDILVLNGAFGDDVVMNFTTTADRIDATAGNYKNGTFNALVSKDIKADDPHYGLLDTTPVPTLDAAGKTLLVVENTATAGVKDYWFFEVTSEDKTLDKDDTITLLGTITTGTDAIAVGDITV
ncbi:MAG: hypothetical protein MR770_04365 [Desulfovibrio piger]|nr:hypothetical protein [Desulfovibrio piger]